MIKNFFKNFFVEWNSFKQVSTVFLTAGFIIGLGIFINYLIYPEYGLQHLTDPDKFYAGYYFIIGGSILDVVALLRWFARQAQVKKEDKSRGLKDIADKISEFDKDDVFALMDHLAKWAVSIPTMIVGLALYLPPEFNVVNYPAGLEALGGLILFMGLAFAFWRITTVTLPSLKF